MLAEFYPYITLPHADTSAMFSSLILMPQCSGAQTFFSHKTWSSATAGEISGIILLTETQNDVWPIQKPSVKFLGDKYAFQEATYQRNNHKSAYYHKKLVHMYLRLLGDMIEMYKIITNKQESDM